MEVVFWRILGNDLPPRHSSRQTLTNLQYVLEHEPTLVGCTKKFLLNRIVDAETVHGIKAMLNRHKYEFEEIPFDVDKFKSLAGEGRFSRIRYVTNLNPARNFCIHTSRIDYDFTLPFDGNCFFREDGWSHLHLNLSANDKDPYFYVPMWRMGLGNPGATDCTIPPMLMENYRFPRNDGSTVVVGYTEPQLVFGRDADVLFNESRTYGVCDKAELLWRLGIAGVWDRWEPNLRLNALKSQSAFSGRCKRAGFVCRLSSGNLDADSDSLIRGTSRNQAVELFVSKLEQKYDVFDH